MKLRPVAIERMSFNKDSGKVWNQSLHFEKAVYEFTERKNEYCVGPGCTVA